MATKCEKRGCEEEACNELTFPSPFHGNVHTDYPVAVCEEHTEEARKFDETDVDGLKKWLNSDL
jgi:hypothetical protein